MNTWEAEAPDAPFFPVIQDRGSGQRDPWSLFACDPNLGLRGQIAFVAMRDVHPGEELTHDWAMTDSDDSEMLCHCGAACCRGTVAGQDWARKDLQEKYRGYFSWYLERKISGIKRPAKTHHGDTEAPRAGRE